MRNGAAAPGLGLILQTNHQGVSLQLAQDVCLQSTSALAVYDIQGDAWPQILHVVHFVSMCGKL